ncbi:uncharacterized protein LOC135398814 [Ornithodoros turicata]|uniref:uncharacterized protein LOC135398814 n=1 Tax=Ornithodoros turicata TaxID=34597 RepID=UPI003138943B
MCRALGLLLLQVVLLRHCSTRTTDLNEGQLRLVADSLTMTHCRRLVEAMRSDDGNSVLLSTPTGENEPKSISCFRLLEHWNNHRGPNSTFQVLLMRLQELGRRDLADALAQKVYGEKALAVQETLLDNPFKKLSPPGGSLHDRSQFMSLKEALQLNATSATQERSSTFEVVAFSLSVSLIMLLAVCICDRVTSRCTIKIPRYNARRSQSDENFSDSTMHLLPNAV